MGLAATLSLCSPAAHAQVLANKADTFLTHAVQTPTRQGRTSVIVRTRGPLTAAQQQQLQALGADVYRHLPLIESVAVSMPARNLSKLAALPFVIQLSLDAAIQKTDAFSVGSSWREQPMHSMG